MNECVPRGWARQGASQALVLRILLDPRASSKGGRFSP